MHVYDEILHTLTPIRATDLILDQRQIYADRVKAAESSTAAAGVDC